MISTNLEDASTDFVDERPVEKEDDDELDYLAPFEPNDGDLEDPQKLIPLEKLKINPNDNILLVFGSEGEGVSRAISKAADHRIVIPP